MQDKGPLSDGFAGLSGTYYISFITPLPFNITPSVPPPPPDRDTTQELLNQLNAVQISLAQDVLSMQYQSFEAEQPVLIQRNELLKTIPEFWCRTLRSHVMLVPYFDDIDTVNAMNYCTTIFAAPLKPPKRGFTITFVSYQAYFDPLLLFVLSGLFT